MALATPRGAFGHPFAAMPAPDWLARQRLDAQRASYGPHDAVTPSGAEAEDVAVLRLRAGRLVGGAFTWSRES